MSSSRRRLSVSRSSSVSVEASNYCSQAVISTGQDTLHSHVVDEDNSMAMETLGAQQSSLYNQRHGLSLGWQDLTVTVKGSVILDNVNGMALPGKLTAVMGPSGSGKSTLIKTLTGRKSFAGKVLIDNEQVNPQKLDIQRKIAYVAYEDSLEPTATVYESIRFSAILRLDCKIDNADVDDLIDHILDDLHLEKCRDTQSRFLSAGERRRLSIAMELVIRPSIIVLDEPTSGLDSYSSSVLLESLKQIASTGASLLFSIHHPNVETFNALDQIILLNQGRVMLSAPASGISQLMERHGVSVPMGINPAEWILEVAQRNSIPILEEQYGFFDQSITQKSQPRHSSRASRRSSFSVREFQRVDKEEEANRLGLLQEVMILLEREWNRHVRNWASLFLHLAVPLFGSFLLATAFSGVADGTIQDLVDFQSHVGALFFNYLAATIMAPSVMMDFVEQRPLFEREYRSNHYGLVSYALVRTVSVFILSMFQAVMANIASFWAIGFQSRFWYFFLTYWMFGFSLSSLCEVFGALTVDPTMSKEFIGVAIFPQALLCGFFVSVSQLPSWIQWASYAMSLTHAFRLALGEEFRFCGHPSTRDSQLLKCMEGLGGTLGGTASYKNDSVLTLPQTGLFEGEAGIVEYQSITTVSRNPDDFLLYETCLVANATEIAIHSLSEQSCELSTATIIGASFNPKIASEEHPAIELVLGLRLVADFVNEKTINRREDVLFSSPSYDSFLDPDPNATVSQICDVLENVCGLEYFPFSDQQNCFDSFSDLPVKEVNKYGQHVYTGNSTVCRLVHSYMAREQPEVHCPHISYASEADLLGRFKCDDEVLDKSFHNFTQSDLALFQRVALLNGIQDPSLARYVSRKERLPCQRLNGAALLQLLSNNGEFEDLNPVCYGFLKENDTDMTGVYWVSMGILTLTFRIMSSFLLRMQTLKDKL